MTYFDALVGVLTRSPGFKEVECAMKWKNVHKDELPANGQEVLLAVDGIYYHTRYNSERGTFNLKDDPTSFFSVADREMMHWVEIETPAGSSSRKKPVKA